METCETCRWWRRTTDFFYPPDFKGERIPNQGQCRIRSTPQAFPIRFSTDYCGEYSPTPTKEMGE